MKPTDELFNEILAERYARLMVIRVGMAMNLCDLSLAKGFMAVPLMCNHEVYSDIELLSVAKEDLYTVLLKKMRGEG